MGCIVGVEDVREIVIEDVHKRNKCAKIDCRKASMFKSKIQENISILEEEINPKQIIDIKQSLLKHFIFSSLVEDQTFLNQLILKFKKSTVKKGEYIFRQGDTGTCFFIIAKGKVSVQVNCTFIKNLNMGDSFGQLAIVYSARRSSSIKVTSQGSMFYFLEQRYFHQAIKCMNDKNIENARIILKSIKIFNYLTNKHKYSLVSHFVKVNYKAGEVIFNTNDEANSLFIVHWGCVKIIIPNKNDIFVNSNEYFGEGALFGYKKRVGTAIAEKDTQCFALSYKVILENLGNNINSVLFHNLERWALRRNSVTADIPQKMINEILNVLSVEKAYKYEILKKIPSIPSTKIYIPLDCEINENAQVKIYGIDQLASVDNEDTSKKKIVPNADIIVTREGHYAYTQLSQITRIITRKPLGQITNQINIPKTSKSINNSTRKLKTSNNIIDIKLQNFILEDKLGEGQFGQVFLVRDKRFCIRFAIKRMKKTQIAQQQLLEAVIREKQLLEEVNSDFVEGYYQTQSDKDYIYFILQYINGVQLFDVLREIGLLPSLICKYYLASIACALQYLHSKNIMYRDIKPENAMVNERGELLVIDLGTAKKINPDDGFRTHTIIGTPHYMAPQMSSGNGYSLEIDYWAFGVIAYEFICGRLPFGNDLDDPYEVFKETKKKQLTFPKFISSNRPAITLIQGLLQKNPLRRMKNGWDDLKSSEYFISFDWNALKSGEMESPYIPKKFKKAVQSKKNKIERPFPYDKSTLKLWDLTL